MCFIRINPSTAPLNPPGAAPTLTTIYDEAATAAAATTLSPSDSLSIETPTLEPKPKRRRRPNLFGIKAAKEGVVGTEKEKRRTQIIADSLDLGGDLQTYVEQTTYVESSGSKVAVDSDEMVQRRKTVATEMELASVQ